MKELVCNCCGASVTVNYVGANPVNGTCDGPCKVPLGIPPSVEAELKPCELAWDFGFGKMTYTFTD